MVAILSPLLFIFTIIISTLLSTSSPSFVSDKLCLLNILPTTSPTFTAIHNSTLLLSSQLTSSPSHHFHRVRPTLSLSHIYNSYPHTPALLLKAYCQLFPAALCAVKWPLSSLYFPSTFPSVLTTLPLIIALIQLIDGLLYEVTI